MTIWTFSKQTLHTYRTIHKLDHVYYCGHRFFTGLTISIFPIVVKSFIVVRKKRLFFFMCVLILTYLKPADTKRNVYILPKTNAYTDNVKNRTYSFRRTSVPIDRQITHEIVRLCEVNAPLCRVNVKRVHISRRNRFRFIRNSVK